MKTIVEKINDGLVGPLLTVVDVACQAMLRLIEARMELWAEDKDCSLEEVVRKDLGLE